MFMDKFQDPVEEIDRIVAILEELFAQVPQHDYDNALDEIKNVFIHKLLIKAYRLGKEHAYAGAIRIVNQRSSL